MEDAYDRFLAGDLTLSNIVVTGGVDALDYDGDVADGDDVLDAYANENGVLSGEIEGLDDMFAFDPSGTFAIDPLNVEVGQGSGHAWTAGWTFCAQRGLFTTVTSVNDVITQDPLNVSVYPNPSFGLGHLVLPEYGMYNVQVFSSAGALVSKHANQTQRTTLPVLEAGTYLIVVDGNGETSTLKWMVR